MMFINSLFFVSVLFQAYRFISGYQGVFWDICDLHLNLSFNSYNKWNEGNYMGDSPIFLIQSAFQQMKHVNPHPDFILVNGDNVYHGDINFTDTIAAVSTELQSQFPNTIILPSLGNHDVQPRNILATNSSWCENWFQFWNVSFENATESEIRHFKKGCFYSRTIQSKSGSVRVIVLNTMLWYQRNGLVKDMSDPLGQFHWLENTLAQAQMEHQKVFLVGHISPGSPEYSSKIIYNMHKHHNKRFLQIMETYYGIIEAGFYAHQHTDAFKIFYNSKGIPVVPIFQTPSVTPFLLGEIGRINPSVRLYYWNKTSANSKYEQYHAKLTPVNTRQPNLNWTLEYTSTELLTGLSANDYNDLITDFSSKHSNRFDKFFKYHLSGQDHVKNSCPTDSYCRCQFICTMKNIDYSKLDSCLLNCPSSYIWIIVLAFILVFIVILLITILLIYIFRHKKRSENVATP